MTQGKTDATSTMGEFAKLASGIPNYIQLTWDFPHLHEDGKMPVLDTNMLMDHEKREIGVPQDVLGDMEKPVIQGRHISIERQWQEDVQCWRDLLCPLGLSTPLLVQNS